MSKSSRFRLLLVPAAFLLAFSIYNFWANKAFVQFTDLIFRREITGNTLNLHYTLEHPEHFGITDYPVTLGNASPETLEASFQQLESYYDALEKVPYRKLSANNRLTYDIFSFYLKNQTDAKEFALYAEPLGPTLGTQAQLPILLAEYNFTGMQDIEEYLLLLSQMDTYFASLMEFEKAKAEAGLFMSDTAADNIISQCRSFITDSKSNFMITLFDEKIDVFPGLDANTRQTLKQRHRDIIDTHMIPAYRLIIRELNVLKGRGVNDKGLCFLPKGREYYEYLVREQTGDTDTPEQLVSRLQTQLKSDLTELQTLLREHPHLLREASSLKLNVNTPQEMLTDLTKKITTAFPEPPDVTCDIKYVHPSLEPYLSPAFYLTPPIDNLTHNVIYINRAAKYSPLQLYTTLAHEGYPGHLYQSVFTGNTPRNKLLSLLNFGGYVEGWATYVEMYSFSLADVPPEIASAYRLNRSITLCISSLLDIAIHYYGYTRADAAVYLSRFGFTDLATAESFYNTILEAPANYLKYYVGYLNFIELRDMQKEKLGDKFSLKEFHRKVLEIGPAPFPVIKKYL